MANSLTGCERIAVLDSLTTVSYTHLDVYKRQLIRRAELLYDLCLGSDTDLQSSHAGRRETPADTSAHA